MKQLAFLQISVLDLNLFELQIFCVHKCIHGNVVLDLNLFELQVFVSINVYIDMQIFIYLYKWLICRHRNRINFMHFDSIFVFNILLNIERCVRVHVLDIEILGRIKSHLEILILVWMTEFYYYDPIPTHRILCP